jgi:hypothetical protein
VPSLKSDVFRLDSVGPVTGAATDLWNILHDGTIAQIRGKVPGDIRLRIEIEYLRDMFSPPGHSIYVTLTNCRRMQLMAPPKKARRALSEKSVTILSAKKSDDGDIVVNSTEGDLVLEYDSFKLELDSGEAISLEQLAQASKQYWETLAREHPWAWPGCLLTLLVLGVAFVWFIKTLFG